MPSRWHGRPGRLEVWYATLTDPRTGEGFWVHHELVAPRDGGAPRRQGWAAAFPPDAPPVVARFAGDASAGPGPGLAIFTAGGEDGAGAVVRDGALQGAAGEMRWDLRYDDRAAPPLHTFPRAAWQRELLPAAHAVAAPTARFSGTFGVGDRTIELEDARGAVARIYGHGNAERWGWLHADLAGGDVLEIVAAISRRPGLDRLAPLSFLQLREGGRDWPRAPLAAAPRLRTELRADGFTTGGTVGRRRLRAEVALDPARSVTLDYDDPDPPGPSCTNSERARCELVVERRAGGGRWRIERHELLDGTAHAEVGFRTPIAS